MYVYVVQWFVCSDYRCCVNKYIIFLKLHLTQLGGQVYVCVCVWKVVGLNPGTGKGFMLGPEVKPLNLRLGGFEHG